MKMFGMEPSEIKNNIFCYKTGKFVEIKHDIDETCEEVCKKLCRRLNFPPLVQLLFGLRLHNKKLWLAGSSKLIADQSYEFRIRIKIPKLSDLNKYDKNTFDYFYHQVRYDVVHDNIPGLFSSNVARHNILGLCVTDMYVEIIEKENSENWDESTRKKEREIKIKYFIKNYKNYIPKKLYEKYSVVKKIEKELRNFNYKKRHDVFYVKSAYIQQVDKLAMDYLIEEYSCTISYPTEDHLEEGTCRVRLQIAPYHEHQPGLRMHYGYKDTWQHVSTFADFYAIQIDPDVNEVRLEVQNSPQGFPITMDSIEEIESFVSCMNVYYRLSVKWTWYLCEELRSPSLDSLSRLKIHGPVGGEYSYNKIKENAKGVGTYIIRQCEKEFDIYYIDILTKRNQRSETFKIKCISEEEWQLYNNENNEVADEFSDLIQLAKSIPIESVEYNRLPPSRYEKPPLLLLCQTSNTIKLAPTGSQSLSSSSSLSVLNITSFGLKSAKPLVLSGEDFRMYITGSKNISDGTFEQKRAEYGERKTEVTLKILKSSEKLVEFLELADKWAKFDIPETVKMHGIILINPTALVFEPLKFGPLDTFLRTHEFRKQIVPLNLIETAYSLARALHYLQEKKIVHGRIRCSSLEVIQFGSGSIFEVKLGDPGLSKEYTIHDVPWIPIEDYVDLRYSQKNLKADIWAYATTLWEIFSRGASPFSSISIQDPKEYFRRGNRLPKPKECEIFPGIYELMKSGWDAEPERRFAPQTIFSRLLEIKTLLSRRYERLNDSMVIRGNGAIPKTNGTVQNGTMRSTNSSIAYNNGSVLSNTTEETYISSLPGTLITTAYMDNCGSSIISNGGSSLMSLINGHSTISNESQSTTNGFNDHNFDGECLILDDDTKLTFLGYIGNGHYGVVYKGSIGPVIFSHGDDEEERFVAIKRFRPIDSNSQTKDFNREVSMMKALNHENIVRIYDFHEDLLLIIMEYMSDGALEDYVSMHRHKLAVEDLLHFAMDIAKGMHYLEQNNIVHRDLAARNVLVAKNSSLTFSDTVCKIADFGLAQFTNNHGYYESTNNRDLPLTWYAPEAIHSLKFSSKSDVWSYGVTLYEMFSFGDSPKLIDKKDVKGEDLLLELQKGTRLKCPNFCPPNVYDDLMMASWKYESDQRPTFASLIDKVRNLIITKGEIV